MMERANPTPLRSPYVFFRARREPVYRQYQLSEIIQEPPGYRLDFRRSLVSNLRLSSGEERELLSRTVAGNQVYLDTDRIALSTVLITSFILVF